MNKKLILFSHHYVNDEIITRFNNLKKLNPTWDIIPIGFEGYKLMDNSITTNKEIYPSNKKLIEFAHVYNEDWANPDFFLYDGYFQMPNYDEYFLYEYDTISNVSIEEFFNTNVDFFKKHILKHCAEEVVKNKHLYCEMLSEIRGGTLVSQITTLKNGREDIEQYISWTSDDIKIDLIKPHFYHPVK